MQLEFFPSRTISFYMGKMFLGRIFAVLMLLVLVLQALDLLGESGAILAHPGNGEAQLWTYVSLRIPQLIQRFLPFAVLLATIITLATLNQNSEVVSMKAAGLSAHQVLAPLLLASFGVALFAFAFNDQIVSRTSATLTAWQAAEYGPIPDDPLLKTNIWVREGDNLINAAIVAGKGAKTRLSGIEIVERTNQGGLRRIITADRATYGSKGWTLTNASAFDVATDEKTRLGTVTIGQSITPDQFTLSKVDADSLSFGQLYETIGELKEAGRRTEALESNLWHKIASPLSSILMPLLGAVAAFGLARSGQLFLRAVIGMALGFAYFVVDNFSLAMGNLEAYPPFLAAWAPVMLFLLIGETVLVRTEE